MKQYLFYISLLFLYCTFVTKQKAYAQKPQNLVWNGDLELLPGSYYRIDPDFSIDTVCPYHIEHLAPDTFFNYTFNKSPFYLKAFEIGSFLHAGAPFCASQVDLNEKHGNNVLSTATGRINFNNTAVFPPPFYETYGDWRGAKVAFKLTDSILQGEHIYVDWMDFFADSHTKSGPCALRDSLPDNVQVGFATNSISQGTVVHTAPAGYRQWQTHRLLLFAPHAFTYLTIGNEGAVNNVTYYMPEPKRHIISTRNFIDNLRLFRVSGSGKRDTVLCGAGPFTLPGKPGIEWEWNDSVTTQNVTINTGDSGWHVCKVFTDNYVFFDSVYVRFDEALSTHPATDTMGCTGQVLQLPSPCTGGYIYLWSNNSTTPHITTTTAGIYWVQSKKGNCTVADTFHVQFAPKPLVYLGADTSFCGSFTHLLDAGPKRTHYSWNTGDKTQTLNVSTPGQYSVTVRDSLNCPNADTIRLEQILLNDIQLKPDTVTCKYVTLTGGPQQNNVNYTWSNGAVGISTQVTQTGNYTLTATHPYCSLSKSVQVTQLPQPPEVNLGADTTLCGYGRVVLQNTHAHLPNYVYNWSNGSTAPRITVTDSGIYTLTVYRNQCAGSDTVTVAPDCEGWWYIPTAFSPNGDNLNDVFGVTGINIQSVHLRIYNRWGEELYNSKGSSETTQWDGTYHNTPCMGGEYTYTVTVEVLQASKRLQHQSGTVNLMR